jgi:hypothetical protein
MLLSIFTVYSTSNLVGSPTRMWELLTDAATLHPVVDNAEGSYLTMRSVQGGYIGLIFVGSGFSAAVDSQLYVLLSAVALRLAPLYLFLTWI